MNPKEIINNGEDAIGFFSEEDILFHITMGMDSTEEIEDFETRYNKTIKDLRTLLEAYRKQNA